MHPHLKTSLLGFATVPAFHAIDAVCGEHNLLQLGLSAAFVLAGLGQAFSSMGLHSKNSGEGVAYGNGELTGYAISVGFGWAASAAVGAVFSGDANEPKFEDVGSAYHEMFDPTFAETLDPVQRVYFNQLEQG